jgi:hypothetical protein
VQITSPIKQSRRISSSSDKERYVKSNSGNNYQGSSKTNSNSNEEIVGDFYLGSTENNVHYIKKKRSNVEIITKDVCVIKNDNLRTKISFPDTLKESLNSIGKKIQQISGSQIDNFSTQQDRFSTALFSFKDNSQRRSPQQQKQHRRQQRQQLIRHPSTSHLLDTLSYHLTSSCSSVFQTFGDKIIGSVTNIIESPSFPHFVAGIAAGALECLVGHPLDTIRVRIITDSGVKIGLFGHLKTAFLTPGLVYIHTYIYTYIHIYTLIYISVYAYMHIYMYIYIYVYIYNTFIYIGGIASLYRGSQSELLSAAVAGIHVCKYMYIYSYIYAYTCIYIFTYIHIYIHIYIYTHINMYTYTHTYRVTII